MEWTYHNNNKAILKSHLAEVKALAHSVMMYLKVYISFEISGKGKITIVLSLQSLMSVLCHYNPWYLFLCLNQPSSVRLVQNFSPFSTHLLTFWTYNFISWIYYRYEACGFTCKTSNQDWACRHFSAKKKIVKFCFWKTKIPNGNASKRGCLHSQYR